MSESMDRRDFLRAGAAAGVAAGLAEAATTPPWRARWSADYREEADLASPRTEYLELGSRMGFQSQFASAMMSPGKE